MSYDHDLVENLAECEFGQEIVEDMEVAHVLPEPQGEQAVLGQSGSGARLLCGWLQGQVQWRIRCRGL